MRGASGILSHVKYAMLEVVPVSRFIGEPTMDEVIAEMMEMGFTVQFFERNIFPSLVRRTECEAFDVVFKNLKAES